MSGVKYCVYGAGMARRIGRPMGREDAEKTALDHSSREPGTTFKVVPEGMTRPVAYFKGGRKV